MKLSTILFALLIITLPLSAEARRTNRKAHKRATAAKVVKPKAKAAVTVNETPAAGADEEEALSFLERAALNARDCSPFALRPVYSATDLAQAPLATKLVDYASRFLGTRYRLGASGPQHLTAPGSWGGSTAASG